MLNIMNIQQNKKKTVNEWPDDLPGKAMTNTPESEQTPPTILPTYSKEGYVNI